VGKGQVCIADCGQIWVLGLPDSQTFGYKPHPILRVRACVRVCVFVEQDGRRYAVKQINLQYRNSLQHGMDSFDMQQCRRDLV
jgi:hypothetical protein